MLQFDDSSIDGSMSRIRLMCCHLLGQMLLTITSLPYLLTEVIMWTITKAMCWKNKKKPDLNPSE